MYKIAITGPESTGKSTLSELLANYFNTQWVPEYSRDYLAGLDRPYNKDDILKIAQGQVEREKELSLKANKYLFCDTELINMKIWSTYKYNSCPNWILESIKTHVYDLYLLCYIDIPWEDDPFRENPGEREFFFNWFKEELEGYGFPYKVIKGNVFQRTEDAIKNIHSFFD